MEADDRERMATFLADLVEGHGMDYPLEGRFCPAGSDEVSKYQISVEDAMVRVLRGVRTDPLFALLRDFSEKERRAHILGQR